MSNLISTRINDPLLNEVNKIAKATDLVTSDLLRLGLRHLVNEFRETGGIRIKDHGDEGKKGRRARRA